VVPGRRRAGGPIAFRQNARVEAIRNDWDRALCVVAHPDDLEYGVASAVARWTAEGKRVEYLLASVGEAGIQGLDPRECGPVREEEERRSAAVVGVDAVHFLAHADGAIEYGLPLRRDIAAAIRRARPDIVVTINFELTWGGGSVNHADHRAVGLAVLDACRDAANRWLFPDAGDAWDGAHEVYVGAPNEATHYVDVSGHIDRGVASLREHRAYIEGLGGDFDPDGFLRGMAHDAGAAVGCEHAVLFACYLV
jgi:LmbE family N-acetylglucosaminyl deacetylase